MNLTEQEIRGLPLEKKQMLVIELGDIKPSDKAYPNAKAIIDLITSDKSYKKPQTVKAKALADVPVDGRDVKKDQEVELYHWQFRALARFFELPKAAAALLIGLALLLGFDAKAQNWTNLNTTSPNYNIYSWQNIAGMNGTTNGIAGNLTNQMWIPVVVSITNNTPSIIISNGVPVFSTNTIVTSITNIPGMVNLTHSRMAAVQASFTSGSTGTFTNTLTLPFYQCIDGSTNAYPAFTLTGTCTNNAIQTIGTNYDLGANGYLLLYYVGWGGTNWGTNFNFKVGAKPAF